MKKIILILFVLVATKIYSQQNMSANYLGDIKIAVKGTLRNSYMSDANYKTGMHGKELRRIKVEHRRKLVDSLKLNLPAFAVQGLGNLNQEALKSINASGKLSFVTRPYQRINTALTVYGFI